MRKVNLNIKGKLPICFMRENKSFIVFSPALDLSSYGKTLEEAKKNFTETVGIFFEECIKMGTLVYVLESCGWQKSKKKGWEPPLLIGEDRIELPQMAVV